MRLFLLRIFLLLTATAPFSCQKKGVVVPCTEKKEQSICINFTYSPFSLDPRKSTDPVTTVMSFMLYEGLTRLESDGTVSMALAKHVKISKDRKTYVFHLRPCSWSDGTPLTAHDFEASWKKVLDPNFPSKSAFLLFYIKNASKAKRGECPLEEVGVKALDDTTLRVELKKPTPYFLDLTSFCTYFPVPFNGEEVPHPNRYRKSVSNGPFMLKSWASDDEIVVVKNPFYWNAKEVQLDEIRATIIADESTALKMYEQGQIDWIGGLISPLPLDAVSALKNTMKLRQRPIAGTTIATFNVHKFPFNNVNIRKAFAYAINRKDIVENVSQMFDDIATGPVPHVLKNHDSTPLFSDNSERLAKKHFELGLQELGIIKEEFPTITYHYFSSELQRNLALSLQNTWKKVLGIEVELKCNELKTHLTKLHNRDFQFAQMSWIGQYHDRMNFLERFQRKDAFRNYSGWESPHYSRLIKESFYKESEERNALLNQAEKLIVKDMPIIPIYHYHLVYVKNPHLKNMMISPMGDIQFHKAFLKSP
jgi:oligopeptide transport system substrate-binding protein